MASSLQENGDKVQKRSRVPWEPPFLHEGESPAGVLSESELSHKFQWERNGSLRQMRKQKASGRRRGAVWARPCRAHLLRQLECDSESWHEARPNQLRRVEAISSLLITLRRSKRESSGREPLGSVVQGSPAVETFPDDGLCGGCSHCPQNGGVAITETFPRHV